MSFLLKRVVDLNKFGWADCTIELQAATYNEVSSWQEKFKNINAEDTKTQQEIFQIIEDKFISGTALDENGKKIDIAKDQLGDLPIDIVLECIASLRGNSPSGE